MASGAKIGTPERPVSHLTSLPSQVLNRILELSNGTSFMHLWATGNTAIRMRLSGCANCHLLFDGSFPLRMPAAFLNTHQALQSLRIVNRPMIAHFPVHGFEVTRLAKGLRALEMNFANAFDKLGALGVQCPSLAVLIVRASLPSQFPPLTALPNSLTVLELHAPRLSEPSPGPDLCALLCALPLLQTFCVTGLQCNLNSKITSWPPYLQVFVACVSLSDHSLFGEFPASLRHLDIELVPRTSDPHGSYVIDTSAPFPWSDLPEALEVLRYKGWTSSRPEELPPKLKVFSYEQVPNLLFGARPLALEEIMSVRQWYWRTAPQHLEEFKLRICTGAQRVRVSEIPLLPPSLTSLDIAPSIQEKHFPMLSHKVTKLVLSGVSPQICADPHIQLPPSLTSLTLNTYHRRCIFNWTMPDSLRYFHAPNIYFPEPSDSELLPPSLLTLCCSSTSLPSSIGLKCLPNTLTDLTIVMSGGIVVSSNIPGVPKNKYHDLVLQGTANSLPSSLLHLRIQYNRDQASEVNSSLDEGGKLEIGPFLRTISPELPLETLNVSDNRCLTMSDPVVFSRLPATLLELVLPVSKATASLFQCLPRQLRALSLHRTDNSFENATVSHLSMLPRGLVSFCIRGYPASTKDITELRPQLLRVVV